MVATHYYDADQVMNYTEYNEDYLQYCVPFNLIANINIDLRIMKPISSNYIFNVKGYVQKRLSDHTFMISSNSCYTIIRFAKLHFNCIKSNLINEPTFCRSFRDAIDTTKKYMMKIIDTPNYRSMNTALKEIIMQEKIYTSFHKNFRGSNIVTEPIFCTPFWNGRSWQFMIISVYAEGKSLHKFRGPFVKLFKMYDKQQILNQLYIAVKTLWILGFSHNDLSDYNIVYDVTKNSVKIIDFESAVKLPQEFIESFRNESNKTSTNIIDLYMKYYKYPSLSLLKLSETACCKFLNIKTDDLFLAECDRVL